MRPSTDSPRSAPRINYVNSSPKPALKAEAPAPQPGPVDQFVPAAGPTDMDKVNAAKVWLQRNRDAKLTSDAIMICLSPLLSGNTKGPIDLQIQALLMQIMAKMDGAKRKDGFEQARVEELKKSLRSKDALTELKKIERSMDNERKVHSQENDRGMETLSAVTRAQNDMLMNSLRDMRA